MNQYLLVATAVFLLVVCNTTCLASKSYTVRSAMSTITLGTTCRVQVEEEFIVKFEGSYERMERALCTTDMPNYASTFDVSNLKVISNHSTIHKTEIKVKSDCYVIHAFLYKSTPTDRTTTVKFKFYYRIKGPFATMKYDERKREFELGWNMKFKKGLVESATFRVEYQKELYETDSETSVLSHQFRRFERNFTNVSPNDMMSMNLKGYVISSLVESCPKSDNLLVILCTILFIVAVVALGGLSSLNSYIFEKPKNNFKTKDEVTYDTSTYNSGGSSESCGCDFN